MRYVGLFASCRHRLPGIVLAGGLAMTGMGCHQYYYYGDQCAPGTAVSSSVRTGPVCDVPTEVVDGGAKLAAGSSRSTVVTGATSSGASSRVVVSEASEPTKVAWKRSDPDGGLATTSVQGTLNDTPINR
jgi:hypothetical protein